MNYPEYILEYIRPHLLNPLIRHNKYWIVLIPSKFGHVDSPVSDYWSEI